ncbi:hypothetical protein PseudUWO311_21100 [Pseudanabaena sp. UWO311]|nr:hypothetical protein [Pseudanabaena sp. UWO311]TYQ23925.1 hypothetical protein PseudUWO311_21100 [Pseudanabaena sp. UWO311]
MALLFVCPALITYAQQETNYSHASTTSTQEENVNLQKTKDFFDDLRGLVNAISPTSPAQPQTTQAQLATSACDIAVGYWWWDARRFPVSIYADGGILADDAASGGRISANWTCSDPNLGLIKISWSTGITDFMYAIDRNRMSGNNGVNVVNAVRRDVGL